MLVLRSSIAVGAEGDNRWSYSDLQSVTTMGGLREKTSRHWRIGNLPSSTSVSTSNNHLTVPVATDMDWLSAAKVELTALASLWLRHIAGVHCTRWPFCKCLEQKAMMCPPGYAVQRLQKLHLSDTQWPILEVQWVQKKSWDLDACVHGAPHCWHDEDGWFVGLGTPVDSSLFGLQDPAYPANSTNLRTH